MSKKYRLTFLRDECIGCCACCSLSDLFFKINEEDDFPILKDFGSYKNEKMTKDYFDENIKSALEIVEMCPVGCIKIENLDKKD